MPLHRLVLSLVILTVATPGCMLDRSGLAYNCEARLMDDAALHTDGAIPGWCLDRLRDGSTADAGAPPDAGPEDGGDAGDAELPDAGPSDAGTDAGRDAGPEDGGPPDSGPPDAGPPDAGPSDAGTDAGRDAGLPPVGCDDGTVEQPYVGRDDMVGCDGALTQCEAAALCGAGWHLCTFAEYRTRGGAVAPATTYRWLAGCTREMCGGLVGPGTAVCASCAPGTGTSIDVSYDCSASRAHAEAACNQGITADTDPIGNHLVSPALECVRARIFPAAMTLGATCCR
ncbi:hypothetical protein EPO33_02805 [Patescibacteria group bacterium]|nr:MAG: hypothetical protein EPO33_02805 [Patescibacteria group bacterium]